MDALNDAVAGGSDWSIGAGSQFGETELAVAVTFTEYCPQALEVVIDDAKIDRHNQSFVRRNERLILRFPFGSLRDARTATKRRGVLASLKRGFAEATNKVAILATSIIKEFLYSLMFVQG